MNDFREWLSDNLRYFLLGFAIVIAIVLIFFGVRLVNSLVNKDNTQANQQSAQEETKEPEVTATPTAAPEASEEEIPQETETVPELVKDENLQVTNLMQTYYTAMGNKDIDAMKACVNVLSVEDEQKITNPQYIEGFYDVETYTKPGVETGSYVAFVKYSVKLKNIETLYPMINQNYISTDTQGNLYIVATELSAEQQEYVSSMLAQQDVIQLVQSVEAAETEAENADAALRNFISELGVSSDSALNADDGTVIVATTNCNVRAAADENGEILGRLSTGQQVTKTSSHGAWIQIDYNGQPGYVRADLMSKE